MTLKNAASLMIVLFACLLSAMPAPADSGAEKSGESGSGARAMVHIRAPQPVVWKNIIDVQQFDNKIDGETTEGAVVEQRFTRLPLFGEMVVVFEVTMVPQQRVDFKMTRSNCLKAFSGNWLLIPINDMETDVEMHAQVDPGVPIPQFLVNQFIAAKMHKRLLKLKKLAESETPGSQP